MLNKLDYSLVPNDFALCFNGKCLHASTCLRYQASRYIPKERWAVKVVNPDRVVPMVIVRIHGRQSVEKRLWHGAFAG